MGVAVSSSSDGWISAVIRGDCQDVGVDNSDEAQGCGAFIMVKMPSSVSRHSIISCTRRGNDSPTLGLISLLSPYFKEKPNKLLIKFACNTHTHIYIYIYIYIYWYTHDAS